MAVARELLRIQFLEFQSRRFPSGKLVQFVIEVISSKDRVFFHSWASVILPCESEYYLLLHSHNPHFLK